MIVHYIKEENGYFQIKNNGKVMERVNENIYDITPTENLDEYEATINEDNYNKKVRENDLYAKIKHDISLGLDVSELQTELRALLEDTHDNFIIQKQQQAIDDYTLELAEMGVM